MTVFSDIVSAFTSFLPGFRLVDGGQLKSQADLIFSYEIGITAHAGGGQTSARALTAALNRIDTVATSSDSVKLPQAVPGRQVSIDNASSTTLAIFGVTNNPLTGAGDTIAAYNSNTYQATGTGVTQATTRVAVYQCLEAGKWKQCLT